MKKGIYADMKKKLKIRVNEKRNLRGYRRKIKNPCKWKKEFTWI